MESVHVEAQATVDAADRVDHSDCHRPDPDGDLLAPVSTSSAEGVRPNATLYFIVPDSAMTARRVGEWISRKERVGLVLHSIQLFQSSGTRDCDPIHYSEEIRLGQTGPILVLGFKEA